MLVLILSLLAVVSSIVVGALSFHEPFGVVSKQLSSNLPSNLAQPGPWTAICTERSSEQGVVAMNGVIYGFSTEKRALCYSSSPPVRNRKIGFVQPAFRLQSTILGFSYENPLNIVSGPSYAQFSIPLWFIILLASIAPARLLQQRHRQRQQWMKGRCPRCSYDLRASPDRCPECGLLRTATATQTSSQ